MSDISLFECIYEQLKSVKNNKFEFEKASSIINTAYIMLEKAIETTDNSIYLKKTREILNEIDDMYLSSFSCGLEDSLDINSCESSSNYARSEMRNLVSPEIFN